jgi:hypothetical protein
MLPLRLDQGGTVTAGDVVYLVQVWLIAYLAKAAEPGTAQVEVAIRTIGPPVT